MTTNPELAACAACSAQVATHEMHLHQDWHAILNKQISATADRAYKQVNDAQTQASQKAVDNARLSQSDGVRRP